MADWKIIIPIATTNLCTNPSFETNTTGWNDVGANTIAQSSAQAVRGAFSLLCTFQDSVAMAAFPVTVPAAGTYTMSCRLYVPSSWDGTTALGLFGINFAGSSETQVQEWDLTTFDEWVTLETEITIGVDTAGELRVLYTAPAATAGRFIYIDRVQIESGADMTTYCDGDQPGCAWDGTPHNSASSRSGAFRGGGLVQDLKDIYNFAVVQAIGIGMPPISLSHDSYSLLPGGELNGIKTEIRPFTLQGNITGTGATCQNLHDARQTLEKILAHDTYPKSAEGWQPVRLRYTGADVTKEADVHYARGLEGSLGPEQLQIPTTLESVAVGFEQDTVFWEAVGDGSQVLDTNDTAVMRHAMARLKSTGQWDALGPTASGGIIRSIAEDDVYVYYGGLFLNWDGDGNSDNIVRWHKQDQAWSPLATGLNGAVNDMVIGSDGTLYVVGIFTDAGGDANADYIAQWNGAAFSAVGIPVAGASAITSVDAVEIDLLGNVWVGGDFLNFANVANADYIAYWDGTTWTAAGTGADGTVESLAVNLDNVVFASGGFANIGGVAAAGIAQWDGSAWIALGTGLNNQGNGMAVAADNTLYVVGAFTTAGGITANRVAFWNGTAWGTLGSGLDATALEIDIAPDGIIYVSGNFTEAGGITLADSVAKWNGSSWAHLDVDLSGLPSVGGLLIGAADPVIENNYDIWIGFAGTGTATFGGLTTTTNDGNTPTYPQLVVNRSGGTEAILQTLRNETTGLELLLDYSLLDDETLTIDLNPQAKTIISSMFGSRPDAMLAGSDFGEWSLLPDGNEVTCFVSVAGGPTVVAYLIWPELYKGID